MSTLFSRSCWIVTVLPIASAAHAANHDDWQSSPLLDRFTVSADAFFPNLSTKVSVSTTNGPRGLSIDFEQELGMSKTETLPAFSASWRFAKKHRLRLDAFRLNRSGSAISKTDITFGDETFSINLPISSFFDLQTTSLQYGYSFILDERKELAANIGLTIQDFSLGLVGNNGLGVIETDSGLTAPVPTIGLNGGYAFSDKWVGRAIIAYVAFDLALSADKQLGGEVVSAGLLLQHNTFKHLHFALRYSFYDIQIDYLKRNKITAINYRYHGPSLTFTAAF